MNTMLSTWLFTLDLNYDARHKPVSLALLNLTAAQTDAAYCSEVLTSTEK